jgi:hypothetical protein
MHVLAHKPILSPHHHIFTQQAAGNVAAEIQGLGRSAFLVFDTVEILTWILT